MTTNPTAILDTGKRVIRTAIQTGIPTFIAFAGVLPQVLPVLHVYVGPRLWVLLVSTASVITGVAATLAAIMANPKVNALLATIGLGGHSGAPTALDTHTSFISLPTVASPDAH